MAPPERSSAPSDRPVPWRMHLGVFAGCGVALLALLGLAQSRSAVEVLFAEGFGNTGSRVLTGLSAIVPFSVAEWIEAALIVWLLVAPMIALRAVRQGRRTLRNVVTRGALQLGTAAMLAATLFYGLWGLNYARAPAIKRLGWEAKRLEGEAAVEELASLAEQLVDITNRHYLALHGTDDAGAPTVADTTRVDTSLEEAYVRVTAELGLHPSFAKNRGPAKPLVFSPVTSWLGISGFYFPFTGEANYNTQPPAWQQPHTIAHEKAHQRGIASEDEANFFGFLACIHSDDPLVAYSGWLSAQRKMLGALIKADRARGKELLERRLPGVQRDVDAASAFWKRWDGYGHSLGSTVNDAYLKTNRVEGGIKSYGRAVRLLVAYARQRGGTFEAPET